jgi:hypothetical protein
LTILSVSPPISLRLSSESNLPALPSNPASDSHRLSDPFGKPSDPSPAFAFNRTSGPAFRLIFNSRLRSAFQLRLLIDLRPSPLADLPALPANRASVFAFAQSSGSAFRFTFSLRLRANHPVLPSEPNLRLSPVVASIGRLRIDPRLAPPIYFPAALASAFGFRLWSTLQLYSPLGFRLAPSAQLPALPLNPTSDSHRLLNSFGAAFRLTFGFRRRSAFRPGLRTQLPIFAGCCIL